MAARGVLLNRQGAAEGDATVEVVKQRYMRAESAGERRGWNAVLDDLHRSSVYVGNDGPMAAGQNWRQPETPIGEIASPGTAITNTTSETIMVPDVTIQAGTMYEGRAYKYTIFGEVSTVITTPGTLITRLRWGGVAGTVLAASGAFAPDPDAGSTSLAMYVEYYTVCRSYHATTGAMMTMGRVWWGGDINDATVATIKGNLDMHAFPNGAAAGLVSTLNTKGANALTPTFQSSVATSPTNFTAQIGILESLS